MNQFWIIVYIAFFWCASFFCTAQIESFPYEQGFESVFTLGESVEFLPGWTGNTVAASNRIFQGTDANAGSHALGVQVLSSFDAQLDLSLNLSAYQQAEVSFFAKSNSNGSGDRSALVYFAISVDGGLTFSESEQIGADDSFPNASGEVYSLYSFSLPEEADGQAGVIIRITVERNENDGFSGSAAELVIDDFSISAVPFVDSTPPEILEVNVLGENTIEVTFNEPVLPVSVSDFMVSAGVEVLAIVPTGSSHVFELSTTNLINGLMYTLAVEGVSDLSGNVIAPGSLFEFTFLVVEEVTVGDLVFNEFLADPTPVIGLPEVEFVELLNVSEKFIDLSDVQLNGSIICSYILPPDGLVLVVAGEELPAFSTIQNVATIDKLSLTNSGDELTLEGSSGQLIAQLTYENSVGGISYELVNPFSPCLTLASYQLALDSDGGTPGVQNSVFDPTPDSEAPFITNFSYDESLILEFSEAMDGASLLGGSYEGVLTVEEIAVVGDFPGQVELEFIESLVPGEVYELEVSEIADCAGNVLEPVSISFGMGKAPGFSELLITEIYFDETPSFGLPDAEYIELFNATDYLLSTAGVQFADAAGSVFLDEIVILPQSYIVVSKSGFWENEEVEVMELAGFPSLNNSGETLSLSIGDLPVFSVTYDPAWHEDFKRDGGFALEMVDYFSPCVQSGANWRSSLAAIGGTPGMTNSVSDPESVPDSFAPTIDQVIAWSADSLILVFSEKFDPATVVESAFAIDPPIFIADTLLFGSDVKQILLKLGTSLQPDISYSIQLSGIADCAGNQMEEQTRPFGLPREPVTGEVLLSEVLFNPRSGGVDFVECYNASSSFLTLLDWNLARLNEDGFDDPSFISKRTAIISPKDFIVFTENPERLASDYPSGDATKYYAMESLPAFSNDTGNVIVLNSLGEIQDQLFYDEDYHYALLEDVDGVSLERVSYEKPTQLAGNWRSAASTAGFATPGRANSQSGSDRLPTAKIVAEPKVFIPGNRGSGRDYTQIGYQFDGTGKFANVQVFDHRGRKVKTLANGASLPVKGFFRWDGDTDGGSMARMGYYLILFEVYDGRGNTEVLKETVVVGRNF